MEDSQEVLRDVLSEGLKEGYLNSLFSFSKHCLNYQDINLYTHQDMIECLESESKRKLIVMPRGTFKSTLTSIAFPIWNLLKDSEMRILIDSEVYTNSKNFLRSIKGHLQSSAITSLWGEFRSDTWNEGEIIIKQRKNKSIKEASITCGGIETVKVGMHYDLIICDDLNSNNNSTTSEGCEKVIRHHQMNMAILEPGGTYVVVGTRYAVNDLPGHILESEIQHGKSIS